MQMLEQMPNEIFNLKPICYIFDFDPNRALAKIVDYSSRLNLQETNPEKMKEKNKSPEIIKLAIKRMISQISLVPTRVQSALSDRISAVRNPSNKTS